MPGMGTSLQSTNQTVVSAFHAALMRQALFVVVILGILAVAWNVLRSMQLRRTLAAGGGVGPTALPVGGEPAARRLLRIAFGFLWIFDGILQAQGSMPLGLPSGVLQPAATGSPGWVRAIVNFGVTIWNNHPVSAAAATVWIQVGIGVLVLVAPRGNWSRLAGAAGAGWGLIVWAFGEAFGSTLSPGLTWLFGSPGAVVFYVVAGVLIALPERHWAGPRLGRGILAAMGLFFLSSAVLQAWPGRGFWQGQPTRHAAAGTLTAMVQGMAQTPQPGFLASWVSGFASFDASHGWAVNLFVVIVLGVIGVALLTGRRGIVLPAVVGAMVLCLADWVVIEDLGFLGGVGTDPNSMIPMGLILVAGYVAMTRLPVPVAVPVPVPMEPNSVAAQPDDRAGWRDRIIARPSYALRTLAALGAVGITLIGAAPMALAATNPVADPILNEAIDGVPSATNAQAAPFSLVDQNGKPVTLNSLRGDVVALTFLDPVCTTDCPLIAQEFRDADHMLGSQSRHVEFVAIVANPLYNSVAAVRAFDEDEGLSGLGNWLYLTGTATQLEGTWSGYNVQAEVEPAGSMVDHSDIAFVIDRSGHTRYILDADPGQGTTALQSSFSGVLVTEIRHALAAS